MDALLGMDSSIDNKAIQEAMAKSETGGNSESENSICTNMSIDMSPCTFVAQNNCCANVAMVNQNNEILAGCNTDIWDIVQSNVNSSLQTCSTTADTTLTQDLANTIYNKASQSASSKSTGIPTNMLLLLAILPLLMVGGGGYAVVNSGPTGGIIACVLLVIGGLVCLSQYSSSKTSQALIANSPYSVCDESDFDNDGMQRMQWGQAKLKLKDSDNYTAVDFFPDDTGFISEAAHGSGKIITSASETEDVPSNTTTLSGVVGGVENLPDHWVGLAIFITKASREGECDDYSSNEGEDAKPIVISLVEESEVLAWKWFGWGMIAIAVLLGAFSLLTMKKGSDGGK